ncbi:hypothetical protein PN836_012200 [Ningiella sp. W23]|uniref:hypothetical protein n=1 Tax=Ningiella sp. W23 TaxID=3023715 RepID=UPI003757D389
MQEIDTCGITDLFTLRYAMDKKNDIVNLREDVLDLQSFPERLYASYQAEWRKYVKRALHQLQAHDDEQKRAFQNKVSELQSGQSGEFNELLAVVNTAIVVNDSQQVSVLTTPLKRYVEDLLKL